MSVSATTKQLAGIYPSGRAGAQARADNFQVGGAAEALRRYRIEEEPGRCGADSARRLVHQIGNNLQTVRGEIDLLRLSGALPQESFDTIIEGIENIRELATRLVSAEDAHWIATKERPAAGGDGGARDEGVGRGSS